MTMRRRLAVVAVAALLSSCVEQKNLQDEAIRSSVREGGGDAAQGAGRLQISTTGVATDGRIAKVRGLVQNRFDQPVHGVRYLVTIYDAGSPPRVLDRWQREVDTTIEPGQRVAMSLVVESMYFGSAGERPVNIVAYPVKLGDQDMPPPEGWK